MEPKIKEVVNENDRLSFTLYDINVSFANSIRRTILSDIPVLVFKTETYQDNKCKIEINNTRFHNEIIKHRLSNIPIIFKNFDLLVNDYELYVDENNDTKNIKIVTTEDFKIRNKKTQNILTREETIKIFPPDNKTNMFIDFVRLRPKISDVILGERIKLTCDFVIDKAKMNGSFSSVSKCSYGNTLDMKEIDNIWNDKKKKLIAEQTTEEDIVFEKKDYYILDSQKSYIDNSFDFIIQSISVYNNNEIVKTACTILQNSVIDIIHMIDEDSIPIITSDTSNEYFSSIDNCFDIIFEDYDFTIGKVIEFIIYELNYLKDKTVSYVSFDKMHPHSNDSILRVAFIDKMNKQSVRLCLKNACSVIEKIYKDIYKMF
jgi:DNA-directed RNA polymerase alpha subunit/DNA-directed RNA polymerase subunit L